MHAVTVSVCCVVSRWCRACGVKASDVSTRARTHPHDTIRTELIITQSVCFSVGILLPNLSHLMFEKRTSACEIGAFFQGNCDTDSSCNSGQMNECKINLDVFYLHVWRG